MKCNFKCILMYIFISSLVGVELQIVRRRIMFLPFHSAPFLIDCMEMEALYIKLVGLEPSSMTVIISFLWVLEIMAWCCQSCVPWLWNDHCAVIPKLTIERRWRPFCFASRQAVAWCLCVCFYTRLTPMTPSSVSSVRACPAERSGTIWCAPPVTPRLTKLRSWPCHSSAFATI